MLPSLLEVDDTGIMVVNIEPIRLFSVSSGVLKIHATLDSRLYGLMMIIIIDIDSIHFTFLLRNGQPFIIEDIVSDHVLEPFI